ncbi:hypothetical protein Q067_04856 [Pseudomonas aeruginosa BL13]|nr:hypothetical protein Q067_04856 [Pseudomonas aeruginosa BL13]
MSKRTTSWLGKQIEEVLRRLIFLPRTTHLVSLFFGH